MSTSDSPTSTRRLSVSRCSFLPHVVRSCFSRLHGKRSLISGADFLTRELVVDDRVVTMQVSNLLTDRSPLTTFHRFHHIALPTPHHPISSLVSVSHISPFRMPYPSPRSSGTLPAKNVSNRSAWLSTGEPTVVYSYTMSTPARVSKRSTDGGTSFWYRPRRMTRRTSPLSCWVTRLIWRSPSGW